MTATVIWRPERLTAKLLAAASPARQDAARVAIARASWGRVARSIRVVDDAIIASDPLAPILEKGARPHTIEPKNKVLKLADGRFVTGPVRHPGLSAQPFLRPTLPLWAGLYRRHAVGAFRGL